MAKKAGKQPNKENQRAKQPVFIVTTKGPLRLDELNELRKSPVPETLVSLAATEAPDKAVIKGLVEKLTPQRWVENAFRSIKKQPGETYDEYAERLRSIMLRTAPTGMKVLEKSSIRTRHYEWRRRQQKSNI
jgi:hypothetical protein